MLLPALAWLFIQFSMAGVMLGSSANAMQVEICSSFGIQTISIDPETGEPVEQAVGNGCDWCQSFGVMVDMATRNDVTWSEFERDHTRRLPVLPPMFGPMRLVADFQSRAPPLL
ncbi:DUF2946 family protein [Roseovarius arcticus]|uniref:DUF2946 family protein n=1 Tax=Roseovarius arcticus TaxID=2547404 RepID=UPI00111033AF|nr:DUF2946 family protein [Roseovarius arcticus]